LEGEDGESLSFCFGIALQYESLRSHFFDPASLGATIKKSKQNSKSG
jgi:hypothetical protein